MREKIGRGLEVAVRSYQRHPRLMQGILLLVVIITASLYIFVFRAPASFVHGKVVSIEEGTTLSETAELLEQERIVRSAFWLRSVVILFGGEHGVQAGDYYFERKKNLGGVARMLVAADFGLTPLRVTLPEGASVADMAEILAEHSNVFDKEEFIRLAAEREGYLFPDTYFFLPNIRAHQVVEVMSDTFVERIQEVDDEVIAFGRPIDEIITMASILEREAHDTESRRVIAGILWRRIELGMPLQVDVTFDYINGKNTFELTLDDLYEESPYNTYRNIGLPPGPIANPGLDAILAAVTPENTEYLFFLADRQGTVHYSATFEEHKEKKALYLN